ncbi:unnamed protein product, partial [Sphagnum jensenii]
MGQDLVVIDHKVLSETSARLLAPRQVEKLNGAASVSQSIAAKLMQKDRDYSPLSHNNPKPTYMLGSRKCISGELNFSSMPHCLHHGMSSDMMVVPPQTEYGELMSRQDTKAVEKGQGISRRRTVVTMADGLQCQGDHGARKRGPTASIAWDSLNRSQEYSPQHELAAIPFKWEEAPGKPKEDRHSNVKTIAEAAERATARRILQGFESSHIQEVLRQKKTAAQIVAESLCDEEEASAEARSQDFRALGENSLYGSCRSSHRYYTRTTAAGLQRSSSFHGFRLSVDGGSHFISEVGTEGDIDLVAPAAAKFLVETCLSPDGTSEQNLTRIPFKWEEAPGKPKFDDAADTMPKKLQLPPRLVASPTQKVYCISQDLQGRQRQRSMSGPLLGYHPSVSSNHSLPAQTGPHQQSHPAVRSCSSSKQSISPSRVQALAKHLPWKVSSTAPRPESLYDEQTWKGTRGDPSPSKRSISPSKIQALAKYMSFKAPNAGPARNQGSYEDEKYWQTGHRSPSKRSMSPSKMQAFAMHLSCKVSSADSVTQESSYEDQIRKTQNSSPLKRSISPSKIHALAKHLSCKILNATATESNSYEDTSWQPRKPQHNYSSKYHSAPLEGYHNKTKRSGAGYGNSSLERNSSGVMTLQVNSEQDYSSPAGQEKATRQGSRIIRHDTGPLESSTISSKRSILSPSQSTSPSRIQLLPKQLTKKVMSTQEMAIKDPKWPMQGKSLSHSFTTLYGSDPLERHSEKTEGNSTSFCKRSSLGVLAGPPSSIQQSSVIDSLDWLNKQQQSPHDPWSPKSIFHGPNGNSQVPTSSVPSSRSDNDTHTQMTTPPSITLSKSLSHVSYESFEHCFEEHCSHTSSYPSQSDADNVSPVGSPYLGPASADYAAQESGRTAASEGVKAIMKLCRTGSNWRKSKNHPTPEIWAPTLATYFQSVEQSAARSGQLNAQDAVSGILHLEKNNNADMDLEDSSLGESTEAPTRLQYRMPSVVEQEMAVREQCGSLSSNHPSFLRVKLPPPRVVPRGENPSCSNGMYAWADGSPGPSAPTNEFADGYRSPVYTATLELLSPSRELISKKKNLGKLRGITMGLPSVNIHKKSQIIEAMCKSLKQAIYNCARQCCRNTKLRLHEDKHFTSTEFSFSFCK